MMRFKKEIRIFLRRFVLMIATLLLIGMELIYIQEKWIEDFQEQIGHWIWLITLISFFVGQVISQIIENKRAISTSEFHSASILKWNFLSKPISIQIRSFVITAIVLIILGSQITLFIHNFQEGESIIIALVSTLAMISLLTIQWLAHRGDFLQE